MSRNQYVRIPAAKHEVSSNQRIAPPKNRISNIFSDKIVGNPYTEFTYNWMIESFNEVGNALKSRGQTVTSEEFDVLVDRFTITFFFRLNYSKEHKKYNLWLCISKYRIDAHFMACWANAPRFCFSVYSGIMDIDGERKCISCIDDQEFIIDEATIQPILLDLSYEGSTTFSRMMRRWSPRNQITIATTCRVSFFSKSVFGIRATCNNS